MGAWVIGIVLVAMALFSIVAVMYMVLREHHGEAEEWYNPNAPENQPKPDTQTPAHESSE